MGNWQIARPNTSIRSYRPPEALNSALWWGFGLLLGRSGAVTCSRASCSSRSALGNLEGEVDASNGDSALPKNF